jgi:hypothetical protein
MVMVPVIEQGLGVVNRGTEPRMPGYTGSFTAAVHAPVCPETPTC